MLSDLREVANQLSLIRQHAAGKSWGGVIVAVGLASEALDRCIDTATRKPPATMTHADMIDETLARR